MTQRKKREFLIDNYHLLSYDEVDSTNSEARRLAEGGACHGAVIWALRQTAGRGRMGRDWVSGQGNLFVTFLLSPDMSLVRLPELSFVAGLAALETLAPIVSNGCALHLKWPNDILLDGKKLGGVLIESFEAGTSGGKPKRWVAVGIGVNVEHCPEEVRWPATCLKSAGVEIVSAKIVLSRLIYQFTQCYDAWIAEGFGPVREAWKRYAYLLGEEIAVDTGEETLRGLFVNIDPSGRLLLGLESGEERALSAGDVAAALTAPVGG